MSYLSSKGVPSDQSCARFFLWHSACIQRLFVEQYVVDVQVGHKQSRRFIRHSDKRAVHFN
jgi:hypothetical protein